MWVVKRIFGKRFTRRREETKERLGIEALKMEDERNFHKSARIYTDWLMKAC
jgi:hypothetical protein